MLSFLPQVGRLLPAPGAWMNIVKQALAFPVYAAAGYFVWVFARQTGNSGLGVIIAGLVFLGLSAWLFSISKGESQKDIVLRLASALAALIAVILVLKTEPMDDTAAYREIGIWED